jgi:hypothetical protein
MIHKLTLISVCAFEIALIFFAGTTSVNSNTFEPFDNGVGILCKIKDSKDNKEPLFFLFAEDRQSVSRLRFETNNIRLSETLRTEINANSISWLDREGFLKHALSAKPHNIRTFNQSRQTRLRGNVCKIPKGKMQIITYHPT